jgi:hypothetical protein
LLLIKTVGNFLSDEGVVGEFKVKAEIGGPIVVRFPILLIYLADKLIELIKKHSVNKGIVISDHNYGKVLEVVNRLTLIREGVLLELTDKRGLVEQGYLLSESYL